MFHQCLQQHEYMFLLENLGINPNSYGGLMRHVRNDIFNSDDFKMMGEGSSEEVEGFVSSVESKLTNSFQKRPLD